MKIETTIDMVVPIWGVLCAMILGAFYIVKMRIDMDHMSKELKEIKELIFESLKPSDKK